jgi:hybrid polyketide synthase/nonribosomal peptide synthetase ACE1
LVSDWSETLPHRIEEVAKENGQKVALMDGDGGKLTYSELINRIEAVAEALQKVGVGKGSRVLVFQQPTVDWTCSMLAIMRLGAIYVPLDLRNPLPRLAAVAKDCEASAVLAHDATIDEAPQLNIGNIINVSSLPNAASSHITICAKSDSPAAILYTSGSTGTPKGIIVTHAGLRNEIEGYTKSQGLGAELVLQQSAMTFNHSSDQMYTGLVNGGTVYVVPSSQRGDPLSITKIILEQGITYTKATPAEYLLWLQYGRNTLRQAHKWKRAYGGGEQLTTTVTDELASLNLPNLRFHNSYGPTEISISSHKMDMPYTDHQAMLDLGRIPCGYSLPNYHTYIVDEKLNPVPVGMPGEIYIGGAGVSMGYLNNQSLTDIHFVPNPFATTEDVARGWTRMYRTGDIGYLREDGAMVFKSRLAGDSQVKIRGIRIELSDIESSIVAASKGVIREAVVTLRENDLLVAHVIFAPNQPEVEVDDRDRYLDRLLSQLPLPQYMVPVVAIPIDRFPVSNHSKVDRKAVAKMPLPVRHSSGGDAGEEELSETMLQLREIWRQVLGSHTDGLFEMTPRTNFFLVGGNSLLVIRLQAQIRQTFNIVVPLVKLLSANTLGEMAHLIEEESSSGAGRGDIDWDIETTPPTIPDFLYDIKPKTASDKRVYLVTGGTGFTAHYLLPLLLARDDVETIHCVALRSKTRDNGTEPLIHPKLVYHTGELSLPLLGLEETVFRDLAAEVDAILHMGSVRGYFDNYHLLRSANVNPTRELVKLAAPRQLPIHYLSTIAVLPREVIAQEAGSARDFVPAVDGEEGYIASKWASELILERSSSAYHIPTSIYRFTPSTQVSSPSFVSPEASSLLSHLASLVSASGTIPDMKGWSGRVDFSPVEHIASYLHDVFTSASSGGVEFHHYESPISLDAEALIPVIEAERREGLGRMPLLKWFGLIKAFGLGYLLTGHDTAVDARGDGGGVVVARR